MCLFPNSIHAAKKRYFKVQGLVFFHFFFPKISIFYFLKIVSCRELKVVFGATVHLFPNITVLLQFRFKVEFSETLDVNNFFSADFQKEFLLPIDLSRRDLHFDILKVNFWLNLNYFTVNFRFFTFIAESYSTAPPRAWQLCRSSTTLCALSKNMLS